MIKKTGEIRTPVAYHRLEVRFDTPAPLSE